MERELVVWAQRGDQGAFDLLVIQIVDRLYAIAYRILRNGPSAEDATQQALVDVWRHLPSLRDPDRFDAWAYRLLVHAAFAEHRHRRREAPPGASRMARPTATRTHRSTTVTSRSGVSPA